MLGRPGTGTLGRGSSEDPGGQQLLASGSTGFQLLSEGAAQALDSDNSNFVSDAFIASLLRDQHANPKAAVKYVQESLVLAQLGRDERVRMGRASASAPTSSVSVPEVILRALPEALTAEKFISSLRDVLDQHGYAQGRTVLATWWVGVVVGASALTREGVPALFLLTRCPPRHPRAGAVQHVPRRAQPRF
jgi:hypothetical protein